MNGFFGSCGKYYTGPQRMAMFSRISQRRMKYMTKEDPKELRISDRIAAVLEPDPVKVGYQIGDTVVLTGSPLRGGMVHLHLTRDHEDVRLPMDGKSVEYVFHE